TQHHARRLVWLGLDAEGFDAREIGARRKARTPDEALATWQADLDRVAAEWGRSLVPGGPAYVPRSDSAVRPRLVPGYAAARQAGLAVVAGPARRGPASTPAPARRSASSTSSPSSAVRKLMAGPDRAVDPDRFQDSTPFVQAHLRVACGSLRRGRLWLC